jgi:phosphohistidine phosphatase SixA
MDRPRNIIVLRHAEKPEDENDRGLSEIGKLRAKRLRVFALETYGALDYIFAATDSERSERPRKTVKPLAKMLEQEIHTPYDNKNSKELAEHLFKEKEYHGKRIMICWHHGEIPTLLEHLGVMQPGMLAPWKPDDFSTQIEIVYSHGVVPMAFRRYFSME